MNAIKSIATHACSPMDKGLFLLKDTNKNTNKYSQTKNKATPATASTSASAPAASCKNRISGNQCCQDQNFSHLCAPDEIENSYFASGSMRYTATVSAKKALIGIGLLFASAAQSRNTAVSCGFLFCASIFGGSNVGAQARLLTASAGAQVVQPVRAATPIGLRVAVVQTAPLEAIMANSSLALVQFHGATLTTTTIDGVPYVAMRPICEAIGLDWAAQFTRIKRHPVLSTCVAVTTTQMPGDDQAREVTMLPLNKLNGWLFGISVRRCKPELRERLTQYQAECFDVLASHFGALKPPVSNPTASEPKPEPVTAATLVSLLMGDCLSERAALDIALAASVTLFKKAVSKPNGFGDQVARKIDRHLPQADLHAILVAASMEMNMRVVGAKMELEKVE